MRPARSFAPWVVAGSALAVAAAVAAVAAHGVVAVAGMVVLVLVAAGFVVAGVRDFRHAAWIGNVARGEVPGWSIDVADASANVGTVEPWIRGVDGDAVLLRAPTAAPAGSPFRSAERPTVVARIDRSGRASAERARLRALVALSAAGVTLVVLPALGLVSRYLVQHPEAWLPHNRTRPTRMAGLDGDIDAMSIGNAIGCARRPNGELLCWGSWPAEELGVDGRAKSRRDLGPVTAFAVGDRRFCAVKRDGDGRAICAGMNANGELGDGTTSAFRGPAPVGPPDVVELAQGASFTIARTKDGHVWQWGWNPYEERARPGTTRLPRRIEGVSNAARIAASREHACALDHEGSVFCWGHGLTGQTGWRANDRSMNWDATPARRVEGLPRVDAITLGGDASVAHVARADGTHEWWTWGHRLPWPSEWRLEGTQPNGWGEVAKLPGLEHVTALQIGWASACALGDDGAVQCWGDGQQGRLGDGRIDAGRHPTTTPVARGARAIAGNEEGTCVRRERDVVCWGFP